MSALSAPQDDASVLSVAKAHQYIADRESVDLNQIVSIAPDAARIIADSTNICLNGLAIIPPQVAALLARCNGWLHLNGLSTISDEVAAALATHEGELRLEGCHSISDTAATLIANHRGELLISLESLSPTAVRALQRHHGGLSLEKVITLPLAEHAELLALRSTESSREDGTIDEDFTWLGRDGRLSQRLIPVPLAQVGDVEVPARLLALAHSLQAGATSSLTPRELLSWFNAQRRGKSVVAKFEMAIAALKANGFDAAGAMDGMLDSHDLDTVLVFPPAAPVASAFADALRAPMTRLGYHIVDSDGDGVRFQSAFATGRRRMVTIELVAADPVILRAMVAMSLPNDDATLALAITSANRLNRLSFVGRHRVDLVAGTLRYDVLGAVRTLSDLRTADEPNGVLPRLLEYVETADQALRRLILDEPVHDPPIRELDSVELSADAASDEALVSGASVRVVRTTEIGHRRWNSDEDRAPPQVPPALVGLVMRLNTDCSNAKVYLVRDEQEMEYLNIELAVLATDLYVLPAVSRWLEGEVGSALQRSEDALELCGAKPAEGVRIESVDEILASLKGNSAFVDMRVIQSGDGDEAAGSVGEGW